MKQLTLLCLLFASIQLSGCATGLIFAATSAVTGGSVMMLNDRRDSDIQYNDGEISKAINALFEKESKFRNTRIQAESYNRIVLLTGEARKPEQHQRAIQLAMQVKGVRKVYNEILSFNPRTEAQAHNDFLVVTRVNATLLAYEGINISLLRVTVNHGIVYVRGLVTQQEARHLVSLIQRVDGVEQVVPLFEYVRLVEIR